MKNTAKKTRTKTAKNTRTKTSIKKEIDKRAFFAAFGGRKYESCRDQFPAEVAKLADDFALELN